MNFGAREYKIQRLHRACYVSFCYFVIIVFQYKDYLPLTVVINVFSVFEQVLRSIGNFRFKKVPLVPLKIYPESMKGHIKLFLCCQLYKN